MMTSFAYGPGMHEIWTMEFSDGNGTEIMPDIEDDIIDYNTAAYTGTGVASIMKRYITTDNFATTNFVETVISANALGYDDIGGNSFDNTKGIAAPIFPFNINELIIEYYMQKIGDILNLYFLVNTNFGGTP